MAKSIGLFSSKRDRAEIAKFARKVGQEKRRAREAGKPWTEYRPFVNGMERIGAHFCGSYPGRHTPGRRSVVVAYSAGGWGRTVLCRAHAKRQGVTNLPPEKP